MRPCSLPAGDRLVVIGFPGRILVIDEVDDADLVMERVAAQNRGKVGLKACVPVPNPQRPGRRMQELRGGRYFIWCCRPPVTPRGPAR